MGSEHGARRDHLVAFSPATCKVTTARDTVEVRHYCHEPVFLTIKYQSHLFVVYVSWSLFHERDIVDQASTGPRSPLRPNQFLMIGRTDGRSDGCPCIPQLEAVHLCSQPPQFFGV